MNSDIPGQGADPGPNGNDQPSYRYMKKYLFAMFCVWTGLVILSTILGLFASSLIGSGGTDSTPGLMVFVATYPLGAVFLETGSRNWAAAVAGLAIVALSSLLGSIVGEVLVAGPLAHLHWLIHFSTKFVVWALMLVPGVLALFLIWRRGGVVPKDASLRQYVRLGK